VALGGLVAGALFLLVRHEPDFYRRAALPPGLERAKFSQEFYGEVMNLFDELQGEHEWHSTFTESQINSYLDEDFVRSHINDRLLPEGVSEPHVAIQPDRLRIAFRYGSGSWSAIVSLDLRLWLAPRDPNMVAMELEGLYAGSLPMSPQWLLDRVTDAADRNNIKLTWYRHDGNPVALLRFQADRERPTLMLKRLELQQGKIVVSGRSTEVAPLKAALPLGEAKTAVE
jgi:hypothetical protein